MAIRTVIQRILSFFFPEQAMSGTKDDVERSQELGLTGVRMRPNR